ncbi:MAG: rRNA maturation RNase YbeY [Bacteroidales bacterium]
MSIKIFYDEVKFRLGRSREIKRFLQKVIRDEKKIPGDLNFIFTSDHKLLEINKEFLKHDYFTDVIAFENNRDDLINGEIYISVETVKRNSRLYSVKTEDEFARVMIHSVLHLCGYSDKSESLRKIMIKKQELLTERLTGGRESGLQL